MEACRDHQRTRFSSHDDSGDLTRTANWRFSTHFEDVKHQQSSINEPCSIAMFEGSLEVKLPTIWTDEKQNREEAERRERLEERRVEEKE